MLRVAATVSAASLRLILHHSSPSSRTDRSMSSSLCVCVGCGRVVGGCLREGSESALSGNMKLKGVN